MSIFAIPEEPRSSEPLRPRSMFSAKVPKEPEPEEVDIFANRINFVPSEPTWDSIFRNRNNKEDKQVLHPKFIAAPKTADELFDQAAHIAQGPLFERDFGDENDADIHISGGNSISIPIIHSFSLCQFSPQIMENLQKLRYHKPTQVQKAIISIIKNSRCDILGYAQTGTGKTAAFMLPVVNEIQELKSEDPSHNSHTPFAIIMAPTRELVNQLYADAQAVALNTGVKVVVAIGDTPMAYSIKQVRSGCDIMVTTIGRLVHYVREEIIGLEKLRYFILDEADRFLQEQDSYNVLRQFTRSVLEDCGGGSERNFRTLMFSATFTLDVQEIAGQFLRPNYYVAGVGGMNIATGSVDQTVIQFEFGFTKKAKLLEILGRISTRTTLPNGEISYDTTKTIVFINGRRESDRLAIALAYYGFKTISINSERTQMQRYDAAEKFTLGVYHILVATDVAARGLNFPKVEYVINFDLPKKEAFTNYIHRIGRTGRVGHRGHAISFFDMRNEVDHGHVIKLVNTLVAAEQPVPDFLKQLFDSQRVADRVATHLAHAEGRVPDEEDDVWN